MKKYKLSISAMLTLTDKVLTNSLKSHSRFEFNHEMFPALSHA